VLKPLYSQIALINSQITLHLTGENGTESTRPHQSSQGDDQINEYDSEITHPGNGINTSQTTALRPIWQFAMNTFTEITGRSSDSRVQSGLNIHMGREQMLRIERFAEDALAAPILHVLANAQRLAKERMPAVVDRYRLKMMCNMCPIRRAWARAL